MPSDWNDTAGWDAHYRSQLARCKTGPGDLDTGSISPERLPAFVADLKRRGGFTAWVPGCGLSPLACMLAHLGLEVVATDVSAAAIEFQRNASAHFSGLTDALGTQDPAGVLVAEVHDFRQPFHQDAFDVVFNVRAFQGFSVDDMAVIASIHAQALRPGRTAYFDTMNVQGEGRDQLEQALETGGFVIPMSAANRWYRNALRATGIPHTIILGQPIAQHTGADVRGGSTWDADMAQLREVAAEYRARLAAEQSSESARMSPDAKVAHVIYSTG